MMESMTTITIERHDDRHRPTSKTGRRQQRSDRPAGKNRGLPYVSELQSIPVLRFEVLADCLV